MNMLDKGFCVSNLNSQSIVGLKSLVKPNAGKMNCVTLSDILCEERLQSKQDFKSIMFDKFCSAFDLQVPFSDDAFKQIVGTYTHVLFNKIQ